jgi:ABC-type transporter Mla subunit MlaD
MMTAAQADRTDRSPVLCKIIADDLHTTIQNKLQEITQLKADEAKSKRLMQRSADLHDKAAAQIAKLSRASDELSRLLTDARETIKEVTADLRLAVTVASDQQRALRKFRSREKWIVLSAICGGTLLGWLAR